MFNSGKIGRIVLTGGASVAVMVTAANAFAQAASGADTASADGGSYAAGEIIVTAQKRSENLREVPSSISALTGEQLERTNASQLSDFAAYIPGFQVDTVGPPGLGSLTLRGISVGTNDSSTVGTYVDEVPLGSSSTYLNGGAFTLDLMPYDIERVEVLRGPQGTLYGASTMGGLLKYVTRTPDLDDLELRAGGDISLTKHADDPNWTVRSGINVPIVTDKLAIRASGFYSKRAGYINNIANGDKDVNDGIQKGGRVALLWAPAEEVTVKLTAMVQKTDYDASAQIAFDHVTQRPALGKFAVSRLVDEGFKRNQQLYTATLNWDFGWADLTSASSWSKMKSTVTADGSAIGPLIQAILGLPEVPLFGVDTPVRLDKFTQEIRLSSPSGEQFEWMFGTFFTDEDALLKQVGIARDATTQEPLATPPNPISDAMLASEYREIAFFGNATYKFSEAFDISGGLRWAKNYQNFTQDLRGVQFPVPQIAAGKSSDDVTTYMGSARYKITPDVMLYGRVATSYRPGGANIAAPGIAPSFDADTLTNYEVGIRSQFADRRITLDLTAFYIDWDKIQISVCSTAVPPTCAPDNGGKARSKGIELSTMVVPLDGLQLGLNGSYIDAKLKSLDPQANIAGAVAGARLPLSARWSGSLTADYQFALTGSITGQLGGGYRMVGRRNSTFLGDPMNVRLPAYQAIDLNAGVSSDNWKLSIYARNLGNEYALISGGSFKAAILEPRTVGVSLDLTF